MTNERTYKLPDINKQSKIAKDIIIKGTELIDKNINQLYIVHHHYDLYPSNSFPSIFEHEFLFQSRQYGFIFIVCILQ